MDRFLRKLESTSVFVDSSREIRSDEEPARWGGGLRSPSLVRSKMAKLDVHFSKPDATRAQPASCDGCNRRDFLTNAALLAAATLMAACGNGQIGASGTNNSITGVNGTSLKLADYPALANVGGIATLTMQGVPVAIVRTATATYVALSLVCPHQGTTVRVIGSEFRCPNHGATFSSTGAWTGGQPTSNLSRISTTFDATAGTLTFG
jgi:nitrite reductase/ring-hydroxylating ferredoxin subunit